jgi:hypothetical protein
VKLFPLHVGQTDTLPAPFLRKPFLLQCLQSSPCSVMEPIPLHLLHVYLSAILSAMKILLVVTEVRKQIINVLHLNNFSQIYKERLK